MAIRYSGDTEIRLRWDETRRGVAARVADPRHAWRGLLALRRPATPDAYDAAAFEALRAAEKATGHRFDAVRDGGTLKLRRVFQAPCPCGD